MDITCRFFFLAKPQSYLLQGVKRERALVEARTASVKVWEQGGVTVGQQEASWQEMGAQPEAGRLGSRPRPEHPMTAMFVSQY